MNYMKKNGGKLARNKMNKRRWIFKKEEKKKQRYNEREHWK